MRLTWGDVGRFNACVVIFGILALVEFDQEWGRLTIAGILMFMVSYSVSDFISRTMAERRLGKMLWESSKEARDDMQKQYERFLEDHPEMKPKVDDDKGEK